jgi:hypothetical protein
MTDEPDNERPADEPDNELPDDEPNESTDEVEVEPEVEPEVEDVVEPEVDSPLVEVVAASSAAPVAARTTVRHKARSGLAGFVAIIAIIGVLASVVAGWAHNVLFDSTSVVRAVDQSLADPAVTDALAVYLTDQIFTIVDVDGFVAQQLPDRLQPLQGAIVGGARTVVHDRVSKLLEREETRRAITTMVERSHAALMRLLEGDGLSGGVTIVDGKVTVNTLPLISRALIAVQNLGLFTRVDVPVFEASGDPADQIAQLETILGRDLPPDAGQLVVYQSDRLASAQESVQTAQRAMVVLKRAIVAIFIITAVALIGAVLLAHRRRRMAVGLLIASTLSFLLALALINKLVADVPALALDPGARAAISQTVTALASSLLLLLEIGVILGVLFAIIVWLTGDSERATRLRGRTGSSTGSLAGFVTAHRDAVAIGVFAAAVLFVVLAGISLFSVIVALVLSAVGVWALITAGDGATGVPPAT